MIIEIPGPPIPKARHRSFMLKGHIAQYDPQREVKEKVRAQMLAQVTDIFNSEDKAVVLDGTAVLRAETYKVHIDFFLPFPRFKNKTDEHRLLWGIEKVVSKPDVDNLAKFYLDCANGTLFEDDKQIVELHVRKIYSVNPRTVMRIMPKTPIRMLDKAKGILDLLSPQEFSNLFESFHELTYFSVRCGTSYCPEDAEENPELHGQWLTEAACLLSKISDRYASLFTKISKNFPKFHKENEYLKTLESNLRQGKCEKA